MTRALFLFLALLLAPQVAGGQGGPGPGPGPGPDVELARDLVERGEILPLAQVLARLQEQHPGKVIEVELEYSNGILVYEVDLVTTDGSLIEVDMNAANGTIVDVDEEED